VQLSRRIYYNTYTRYNLFGVISKHFKMTETNQENKMNHEKKLKSAAMRITLFYGVVSAVWILTSDWLMAQLAINVPQAFFIATFKGWLFVITTATCLYLMLRRQFNRVVRDMEERRQLEKTLRETVRQYSTLVENLHGMVYRCQNDSRWTMEYVSAGAAELTGYQPAKLMGADAISYEDLIHPADRPMVRNTVQAALNRREPFSITYRLCLASGEEKWVQEHGRGVFAANGDLEALEGFIADVTGQRRVELALQQSEARYKSMFENSPATMLLVNPSCGAIVDANPAACAYYGWSRAELQQMRVDQINTLTLAEIQAEMEQARQKKRHQFIFKHRRANGSIRNVEVYSGPIRHQDQTLLYSIIHDITDQVMATQTLEKSEARYRLLFENNPHPMWVDDTETMAFLAVNNAAMAKYGYTRAEFLAMTIKDLHPPEDAPQLLAALTADQSEHVTNEWRHRLKDGQIIEVEVTAHRIDFEGRRASLVLIQDITERKRLAAENEKLTVQFYQSQKMDSIGQLAGGIAHDFNNLLVPIIGYAELGMMNLPVHHGLYSNFLRIKEAADRAANLTRQILAFSRQQVLETRLLDLNEVITNFQKMLGRLLREDITLKIHLHPHLRPIKADWGQLEQVLLNLVINARDAMPNGGTLSIETDLALLDETYAARHPGTQPGLYVLLAVSDTGHGMSPETQQRIFEPFFTTKARGHGTGLGLATVFGIIKQHQGNIWVYSEPEQGATFKVYLPVADAPAALPGQSVAVTTGSLHGSETILVVEDEVGVRQLARHILQTYGYHVLEATGPQPALKLATDQSITIHMLLTDVVMPEMNGRQLYNELAQTRPNLKVLFMSGYTDNVITHQRVLDADVNFLAKPFSMHSLLQKTREVLAQA